MHDFQSKKIQKDSASAHLSEEKTKENLTALLAIILFLVLAYWGVRQVLGFMNSTRLVGFISSVFGKELEIDQGHTNLLFLGVGGEGHEGKDLTDTMIVASLDHTTKQVAFFSIPRDLYLESALGKNRINHLYEMAKTRWASDEAFNFVRSTIQEKIIGIPIHYWVKVDFEAFKEVVDALNGIDVYAEEAINDTTYPKDGTYDFEPFSISAGLHHLDGETALKYVRSRHTTSDFDRSRRQQEVMVAMKKKAQEENVLTKKSFLKDLLATLSEHLETNLSLREMLTLANFAADWKESSLKAATLSDEPNFAGGFLYTPLRELYGGAYVLLPAGDNFSTIQEFSQLVLYGPKLPDFPVAILNGTKNVGMAAKTTSILNRFGVSIIAAKNAAKNNLTQTTWYEKTPESHRLVTFLEKIIPGQVVTSIPDAYAAQPRLAKAQIILELGSDAPRILEKLDIFKNIVLLVPPAGTGSSTPATAPLTRTN